MIAQLQLAREDDSYLGQIQTAEKPKHKLGRQMPIEVSKCISDEGETSWMIEDERGVNMKQTLRSFRSIILY